MKTPQEFRARLNELKLKLALADELDKSIQREIDKYPNGISDYDIRNFHTATTEGLQYDQFKTKVFINFEKAPNSDTWGASLSSIVNPQYLAPNSPIKNRLATSEIQFLYSKDGAWETIKDKVKNLDYENDNIYLKGKKAKSAIEVKQIVDSLS